MVDINQIKENSKKFDGTHKFLAEEVLIPNLNKNDQVRLNMFTNHLPQALVLDKPEFPNVFTNFENQVGSHSTAIKKSDREWTIIKKIKKNDLVTVFILKDKENNLEILHINPAEKITERYGYKYHNDINKHDELDTIKEGETIFHSTSYDDNGNFCYGSNLKACFLATLNLTYED
jgi:DNA-directed RNA polymerase beta subunit